MVRKTRSAGELEARLPHRRRRGREATHTRRGNAPSVAESGWVDFRSGKGPERLVRSRKDDTAVWRIASSGRSPFRTAVRPLAGRAARRPRRPSAACATTKAVRGGPFRTRSSKVFVSRLAAASTSSRESGCPTATSSTPSFWKTSAAWLTISALSRLTGKEARDELRARMALFGLFSLLNSPVDISVVSMLEGELSRCAQAGAWWL